MTVAVRPVAGESGLRLVVEGELDLAGAPTVEEAVERALADGRDAIAIDLAGTTFLDSTGLSALLRAARAADDRGASLTVHAPPGSDARLVIGMSGTGRLLGLGD